MSTARPSSPTPLFHAAPQRIVVIAPAVASPERHAMAISLQFMWAATLRRHGLPASAEVWTARDPVHGRETCVFMRRHPPPAQLMGAPARQPGDWVVAPRLDLRRADDNAGFVDVWTQRRGRPQGIFHSQVEGTFEDLLDWASHTVAAIGVRAHAIFPAPSWRRALDTEDPLAAQVKLIASGLELIRTLGLARDPVVDDVAITWSARPPQRARAA